MPTGPGELLPSSPSPGDTSECEPSPAECPVCALSSSQLTLLGMKALSWHGHTDLVGNQFIWLNLQPSLFSVHLLTKHCAFYNIFVFFLHLLFATLNYLQQTEAGTPQTHFHSSCGSYSHNTAHTCWVFSTYSHAEEMDFLMHTGMCLSSPCSWLDNMHNAVCSYPRAPFSQALSWHYDCITVTLFFKLNQNFKVLIHCDVDRKDAAVTLDFDTKIIFP